MGLFICNIGRSVISLNALTSSPFEQIVPLETFKDQFIIWKGNATFSSGDATISITGVKANKPVFVFVYDNSFNHVIFSAITQAGKVLVTGYDEYGRSSYSGSKTLCIMVINT